MNTVLFSGSGKEMTMTSRDIAELIGSRHDNVKTTIERMVKSGVIEPQKTMDVTNHLGQTVKEYIFSGDQGELDSYVVAVKISPQHIREIVKAWGTTKSTLSKIIAAFEQFDVPHEIKNMELYAIVEKDTGNIKIGISADPRKRLKELQTANSSELVLLATMPAVDRFRSESAAHKLNADSHIRGEWYSSEALGYFESATLS